MAENKEKCITFDNSLQLIHATSDDKGCDSVSQTNDSSCSETSTNQSLSKFDKYVYTFLMCYANCAYGISLTCMSPALLDFSCILDTDAEIVTHYYTLYAIGVIIGSLLGFLFKYINRQLTLTITLLLFGIVTSVLPYTPDFPLFYIFGFIGGVGAGSLDIVQTVWLIEMWDEKSSGSILQLSEFTYGIGLIIGPLIIEPFVSGEKGCLEDPSNTTNTTFEQIDYSAKLLTPFLTCGSLLILGAVMLAIMYCTHKYVPSHTDEEELIEQEIREALAPIEKFYHRRYTVQIIENKSPNMSRSNSFKVNKQNIGPRYSIQVTKLKRTNSRELEHQFNADPMTVKRRYSSFHPANTAAPVDVSPHLPKRRLIALGAVCFATILVAEAAYMDYSPTFFQKYSIVPESQVPEQTGSKTALLLSAMFASYTITRFVGIYLTLKIKPQHIMSLHYVVILSSLVILYFSNKSEYAIWFGNILFGVGISIFWSATFSFFETYFEITDRIGTIYVATLGFLEMVTQFIEGPFLEDRPEVLLYYCGTATVISIIFFIIIRIIVFKYDVKTHQTDTNHNNIHNDNKSNEKSVTKGIESNGNNNILVFNEQNVTKI